MPKQLIPAELFEDSIESYLASQPSGRRPVYLAVTALLLGGLVSLPLVEVPVSVASPGVLRSATERQTLRAPVSGMTEVLEVRLNERVAAGQPLLRLRDPAFAERQALHAARLEQAQAEVHDLELLTSDPAPLDLPPSRLRDAALRRALLALRGDMDDLEAREARAQREHERVRALASRDLVPQTELEERVFALERLRVERRTRLERAQREWLTQLTERRLELRGLMAEAGEMQESAARYRVHAPVTGTVEEIRGIAPGSFVQAGDPLLVLSPEEELLAELHVSPRDVSWLRVGDPVRLHVDAFPSPQWGFVGGRVVSMAGDHAMVDQRPVFRVLVGLDAPALELANGSRGELRKGMTVQGHIVLARRTLWQLLRDDVHDWYIAAQRRTG